MCLVLRLLHFQHIYLYVKIHVFDFLLHIDSRLYVWKEYAIAQCILKVVILLIFLSDAILGLGIGLLVNNFMIFSVSEPETLIIATPEIPGPEDRAYIVIII